MSKTKSQGRPSPSLAVHSTILYVARSVVVVVNKQETNVETGREEWDEKYASISVTNAIPSARVNGY